MKTKKDRVTIYFDPQVSQETQFQAIRLGISTSTLVNNIMGIYLKKTRKKVV